MKNALFLITGAAVLSSSVVMADDHSNNNHGLYLGANYGYLKVESDDDFDDDSDALQGLVGYRFNKFIAIEGSYIDFGKYGNSLAEASTDGYTFAVKGMLPLTDHFGLYAKLGQLWWETSYDVVGFNGSRDDEGLFYGAGASFKLTDNLVLNAEYVVYDVDLDADDIRDDIDDADFDKDFEHVALGLEYRF